MSAPSIHSLNCGTMCPNIAPKLHLVDKDPGKLVAHCLLIEAPDGLVLLDTGYGTGDVANPKQLGFARRLTAPILDPAETALAQVRALGHDPADVRHVLCTHLDLDHAGGLPDFPNARVHVSAVEIAAAKARSIDSKLRYRPAHIAHDPNWAEHTMQGEQWFGFERARLLDDVGLEIAVIPLHGHSVGHSGYAINTGDGWLLHVGDAYIHRDEIASPPKPSRGRRIYHAINSADSKLRKQNADRLADLARDHGSEVKVFCSHDNVEFNEVASKGAH